MTQTGALNSLKTQMSAGWKALLRENLRHSVILVRASAPDRYGKVTDGERVRIPCYIGGSDSRVKTSDGEEIQVSWTVDMAPFVEPQINDRLEDGRDRAGFILLTAGRIVQLSGETHPVEGRLSTTVQVARQ